MIRALTPATLWPFVAIAAAGSAFIYFQQRMAEHKRRDAKVDEMVDQSFPASDAPAY